MALAVLEYFVHVPAAMRTAAKMPDLIAVQIALDAEPQRIDDLPRPDAARRIGDAWAASGASLTLDVPSAVIPPERNLLVNPRHPDIARLRIVAQTPFRLDPRLLG